jgi:putative endonuclease
MSLYYVYVLFSRKDYKLYIGFSADLRTRIKAHLSGRVRATKDRLPLEIIHYEAYRNEADARTREKFLKSGFGRNELKKAIQHNLAELGYKFL